MLIVQRENKVSFLGVYYKELSKILLGFGFLFIGRLQSFKQMIFRPTSVIPNFVHYVPIQKIYSLYDLAMTC